MRVKSTLTSLEYDLLSSAIQREQQLDFREFRLFSRANSPIFSRTSGWTRIAKVSRAQGVPAAKEGLNWLMKSWREFRRITAFLRAQVSKLRTSSLRPDWYGNWLCKINFFVVPARNFDQVAFFAYSKIRSNLVKKHVKIYWICVKSVWQTSKHILLLKGSSHWKKLSKQ